MSDSANDLREKLVQEHGEVWEVEADGTTVYIRCPTRAEWKKFKSISLDPKRASDADEMLARDVVVHPDRAGFDTMLERRPGVSIKVAAAAADIAQGDEAKDAKKVSKRTQPSSTATST